MKQLAAISFVLTTLILGACLYEKDVGAEERAHLRDYVEQAFTIERAWTSPVSEIMEAEPLVWDEEKEKTASLLEITNAYERYFSSALPHVAKALDGMEALDPPETAVVFHQSTLTALRGYKAVMESGVTVLRNRDYEEMAMIFERMEVADAAMESARAELGRLLEITD